MGWQDVIAIAAVLGAAGYLLNLVRSGVAGERQAGSACGKCASGHAPSIDVATIGASRNARSE